ncbi:protein OSB3, chloroplastic/mitochondrial-like isoform X2 [Gastrolobium bilobum]|uniref:protein OSB3, chloroplastic/mitochondrial-like isoform X2 n=1 Tax=Gastrolobium bilobum TaxID=150636 RepID=UPI002AB1E1DD|nr:protein OSB3, chloroplastic/mitochondrial-like isoform X2 [Gastrolobium bilobum]
MNSVRRMFRASALILRSYSSSSASASAATRKRSKSLPVRPRPMEIPFQPKVANAVNLIGQVHTTVQFQTCADGNTYAATVITRQESPYSPYLYIPVIFEGDLALTAKTHLQQNDIIHIAGQLSTDPPHLDQSSAQTNNIQVMVQSLYFVKGYPQEKNISATSKQDKMLTASASGKHDINQSTKDVRSKQSDEHDIDKSWKDLLNNPSEWWDVRSTKNPKGAAFQRKKNGELLFVNSSTPKWLLEKCDSITIDLKPELKHSITSAKKDPDSSLSPWRDLLDNPKQWSDFRDSKLNKLVNPRHPDFKRKDGSLSLWLNNRAPTWVSSELEGLEFDDAVVKSKQADNCKGDQSWNDLVENPTKWLDKRSDKTNERAPDFKHKETGQVLWLNRAPTWVLSKLKGLEFDVPVVKSKQAKNTKDDQSWNDLVKNPTKWWDNRLNKKNERAPDFKHKESGEALWLNGSPSWVLSKLPPLEPKQSVETGWKQTLVS